ncbi:MAG: hypothetical protein ABI614_29265, partial [Planctomycetota bacterium]
MINSDDPRLTAYVLDELSDAERAEIESALAASPELQAEIALIRQAATLFGDSLQVSEASSLTDEQRLAIYDLPADARVELGARSRSAPRGRWRSAIVGFAATGIAASVLVALLLPAVQTAREASRRVAHSSKDRQRGSSELVLQDEIYLDEVEMSEDGGVDVYSEALVMPQLDDTDYSRALGGESASRDSVLMAPRNLQPSATGNANHDIADLDMVEFSAPRVREIGSTVGGSGARGNQPRSGDGFELPQGLADEVLPLTSALEGRTALAQRQLSTHYGGVAGEPAIGPVDSAPTVESTRESLEQGRLTGGKGLGSGLSSSRVDASGPVSDPSPSGSAADRLSMRGELSGSGNGGSAHATLEVANAEISESSDINKRSPNAIPKTQLRRQELTVTGPAEEKQLNEQLSRNTYDVDSIETAESKPAAPKQTWRRAQATPNASRLIIGDRDELLMEGMQANVMVDGFRARVLLDLYYFNDRGRQLEGNFKLRLPDDASLYYFAFGESA